VLKNRTKSGEVDAQGGFASPVLASAFLIAAFALPLFEIRPNRIASGIPAFIWDSPLALAAWLVTGIVFAVSLIFRRRWLQCFLYAVSGLAPIVLLAASGSLSAGAAELSVASSSIRISPSSGFLPAFVAFILISRYARGVLSPSVFFRFLRGGGIFLATILAWQLNCIERFSPWIEFVSQGDRFWIELGRHVFLSLSSFVCAFVVGVWGAVLLSRGTRFGKALGTVSGVIQNIPSLALFGLLLPVMAGLSNAFPALRSIGISGIGAAPAFVALTAYALLPVMLAGAAGLRMVEAGVTDAARGMGMTNAQILFRVELPLALPAIAGGARTSLVQTIGTTTIAALIGAGGMGYFVFQGVGQAAIDMVLVGVVPVVAMSLTADYAMAALQRKIAKKGGG